MTDPNPTPATPAEAPKPTHAFYRSDEHLKAIEASRKEGNMQPPPSRFRGEIYTHALPIGVQPPSGDLVKLGEGTTADVVHG